MRRKKFSNTRRTAVREKGYGTKVIEWRDGCTCRKPGVEDQHNVGGKNLRTLSRGYRGAPVQFQSKSSRRRFLKEPTRSAISLQCSRRLREGDPSGDSRKVISVTSSRTQDKGRITGYQQAHRGIIIALERNLSGCLDPNDTLAGGSRRELRMFSVISRKVMKAGGVPPYHWGRKARGLCRRQINEELDSPIAESATWKKKGLSLLFLKTATCWPNRSDGGCKFGGNRASPGNHPLVKLRERGNVKRVGKRRRGTGPEERTGSTPRTGQYSVPRRQRRDVDIEPDPQQCDGRGCEKKGKGQPASVQRFDAKKRPAPESENLTT